MTKAFHPLNPRHFCSRTRLPPHLTQSCIAYPFTTVLTAEHLTFDRFNRLWALIVMSSLWHCRRYY